ncbi:hypothetical protein PaG_06157 [Moesziomyces aphidis]|uniref:Uncharacterized protein n=1 Tax=Moesziomyces aphidis TaxID=84754 RepID=W3VGC8_MOEAP|nr:hypothetical protein PaG_06157 [Moesziomyces aphidis]
MTDNEPRQLLPETESHQRLSAKLGASRPPPPRSRSRVNPSSTSKQQSSKSAASDHDDAQNNPAEPGSAQSAEASDAPDHQASPELEASGSASPVRMTVQRAVSGTSIRSSRSVGAVSDIPKEEIEKALEGLNRDDLVLALGRAKVQMDEIEARLEEQVLENETLHGSTASLTQQLGQAEHEVQSLHSLVKQREDRIDEMMIEQERIEGEVYSTMQIIERLRKQLADSERGRNDAEKRYLDQTATMDKERQYYMDTEALLKSQKATQSAAYEKLLTGHNELLREHERLTNNLASIKANGAAVDATSPVTTHKDLAQGSAHTSQDSALQDDSVDSAHPGADTDAAGSQSHKTSSRGAHTNATTFADERDMATMIEELSTLQKSHSSLSETMVTLQAELKDVRAENVSLRDQNETFMDILQEKTFSGALLNESAMLRGMRSASFGRLRAQDGLLDPYDDDDDDDDDDSLDVDDSADDSAAGGSSVASRTIPEEDEDDVDDVPDTPKAPPEPKLKASRRKRADSSAAPLPTADLASELEGSSAQQHPSPGDRAARERRSPSQRFGVVSDDLGELQKEVRELREANQALTLYISKIIDRIIAREGYENILAVESRGTVRGPRHKASRAKLAQSGPSQGSGKPDAATKASSAAGADASGQASSLFSFGGASSRSASGASRASAPPKSKRASSIDWRSLPFLGGGGSGSGGAAAGETSSNLRPLTLQSDNLLIPPRDGSARKLRTSEEMEDEHDVAERERIRRELLSRGIQPPKHQLVQSPTSPLKQRPQSVSAASGSGGFAAFFSRVVGGASSNALASPGQSDTQSQASTTPGGSLDTGFERAVSSTPAGDAGRREAERTRALQLSEGGSSVTKLSSGPGIASKARQLRAERHQQTLDIAADSAGNPFPSSTNSSAAASRATSGSNSAADSSIWETSIAGDESYTLPPPPGEGARGRGEVESVDSPLVGYGGGLPPLPHETTGDEDPQAFRSPSLAQMPLSTASQDQGWKRAFRRISLLSPTAAPAQPGAGSSDEHAQAPDELGAASSESPAEGANGTSRV